MPYSTSADGMYAPVPHSDGTPRRSCLSLAAKVVSKQGDQLLHTHVALRRWSEAYTESLVCLKAGFVGRALQNIIDYLTIFTCRESASTSLYTATVRIPSFFAVRMTRHAISPLERDKNNLTKGWCLQTYS